MKARMAKSADARERSSGKFSVFSVPSDISWKEYRERKKEDGGRMMKSADITVLKTVEETRPGSSPGAATKSLGVSREGSSPSPSTSNLTMMMQLAVPLWIQRLKDKGGPDAEDQKKAQETSDILGERGGILLHGGGKKGECADQFNRTAHAIAVLAFVPGGVEVFGQHFEEKA